MMHVVAVVVAVSLLVNCTYTLPHYQESERKNPIVVSERVGEVIDAQERLLLGLFVVVEEFEPAQVFRIS